MHTVLVYLFPDLPKVTYISGNKELKSTKVTARGQNIFSILGPLLVNIFMCNLFTILDETSIAN